MAFTPGFKKFVGLVIVAAAVGGGLYAYKSGAIKQPAAPVQPQQDQAVDQQIPQPYSSPIKQAEIANQVIEQAAPQQPAPAPAPQQQDQGNAGIDALLKSGKK